MTLMPDVRVEVAFNAGFVTPAASRTWTDITSYVELGENGSDLTITRGRQDERATIDASTLSLTLDNRDGRFTPHKASSPYFPNVKIGRPIRVTAVGNYVTNSTFETDTATWAALGGASISRVTTQFHEGAASMEITWPTGGALASSAYCNVSNLIVGETYTYSAYVRTPGTPRVCLKVLAATFSSNSVASASWQRLSVTFTATATSHDIEVKNSDATTAGQTSHVDAVMVNRGTSAQTFTSATLSRRFTGYINEWPTEWKGAEDNAFVTLSASSRLARLSNNAPMTNIIAEEYRRDLPAAHYQLDGLNDATGNQGPLQRTHSTSGTGIAVDFTAATGPGTDGLTAATFAGGEWLVKRWEPVNASSPECTVEFFLLVPSTAPGSQTVLAAPAPDAATSGVVWYVEFKNTGFVEIGRSPGFFGDPDSWLTVSSTPGQTNQTIHVAIVCDGSSTDLYINGALDSTVAEVWNGFDTIMSVGGSPEYSGDPLGGYHPNASLSGVIAHLAVYDYTLDATRIFEHATAGLSGFAGEAPYLRVARYAGYAGVPAAENDFDVDATPTVSHIDTTDAAPVELMQRVANTAGSLFFDGRDGTLQYQTRAHRYDAASAFTLDFEQHEIEQGVTPKFDDQGMVNDFTATLIGEDGLVARAVDQDSVDEYGPRAETLELVTADEDMASYVAWWKVSTYKDPRIRVPDLAFDFLPLDAATQAAVMAADVGTQLTVTNWPAQAAETDASFFVEGYTETIGEESYRLSLNVSPAELWLDTWLLDDDPRGNIDSIYRLAY